LSQFEGNGFSLERIDNNFFSFTFSALLLLIVSNMTISECESRLLKILILGLVHLLFNSISEVIFFEFASNFYFPSNAIVLARSGFVILLMVYVVCVAKFELAHFLKCGQTWKEKLKAFLVLFNITSFDPTLNSLDFS
jgi:hypothetical protein